MEFSVRCPSPPNTSSYVQEENLGSTRKVVEIYSLFTCINNLILALHCSKPPSYVPYKGTYVPYDGTYGASDQVQMLDM